MAKPIPERERSGIVEKKKEHVRGSKDGQTNRHTDGEREGEFFRKYGTDRQTSVWTDEQTNRERGDKFGKITGEDKFL